MEIGEIAAASTGDEDFLADFFGVLEKQNSPAAFTGFNGAEEARGAGADNDCVEIGQNVASLRMLAGLKTGHYTSCGIVCILHGLKVYSKARAKSAARKKRCSSHEWSLSSKAGPHALRTLPSLISY